MKILIVGAGFAGSVFGRLGAEAGHSVTIIDRRSHIGGNAYSYKDERSGIEVHKYGPHIFNTNSDRLWLFVNRFSKFNSYVNRVRAITNGVVYSLPINLGTINQFFSSAMGPEEAEAFIRARRIKKETVTNFEEHVLNSIGEELYEAFYKHYSIKQWGINPREIPVSTAKRLPIRFNYNDNYFDSVYQGIPVDGYTELFRRMLDHENIAIRLSTDFAEYRTNWRNNFSTLIFSGSIDDYFGYQFGELPYRTVRFEEIRGKEIQGNAVINYTDNSVDFTRIHEHKWFTPEKSFKESIGFREYSSATTSKKFPYYPIRNDLSTSIFEKYKALAREEPDVLFLGRLAEYRYYNMDQVIASAISKFQKWAKDL
jgi:UDP-galactopyranose mutase